jgi:hypothetical protein
MLRPIRLIVSAGLFLALSACHGSGGGGSDTPPSTATSPSITTQPSGQTAAVGGTATFTVAATGSTPLTYQWSKGGVPITGATSATYTTSVVGAADDGSMYSVVVTNSAGNVTSSAAKLTVTATPPPSAAPPSITTQPSNQTAAVGGTATFTVVAAGSTPLSYQWSKGGVAITGATEATFTTPIVAMSDDDTMYTVLVSNSAGNVTSTAARLTVMPEPSLTPPSITTQPSNQTAAVGETATFSVIATGSTPLSYQWSRGSVPIAGAMSATYTTPIVAMTDDGAMYSVNVSNSAGNVTSSAAKLTVTPPRTTLDLLTYKYDNSRLGQNTSETVLTPANVKPSTFGLLRRLDVDGKVDAQPLYLGKLSVGGALHNVVYVVTEHGSAYAFDADTGATLWHVSLIPSGETTSEAVFDCDQVVPEIGITATPVIDRSAGAMYVVAMSKNGSTYHHRIHALNVTTGAELFGGPKEITASYTAPGSVATNFDPQYYEDRAALLLVNGTVYTTWTSHCDTPPYTGWIIAFSATTLAKTAVLNVAPNSGGAGPAIWMAGGGPAADSAGNIYLLTGNGVFETTLDANGFPIGQDYGNSFLRLATTNGTLTVADYFTMSNEVSESNADADLGSGGIMLLPDLTDSTGTVRHLAVGAGKDGKIYVVERESMGGFDPTDNDIWQELNGVLPGGVWATPAYFDGTVYFGDKHGTLKAFSIEDAKLIATPSSQTATTFGYPGTLPVVSANGTSNAIVWTHENGTNGVLHAYDATDLSIELYNSEQAANGADRFGAGNKFIAPAVIDGKVFVGSESAVGVFGLK